MLSDRLQRRLTLSQVCGGCRLAAGPPPTSQGASIGCCCLSASLLDESAVFTTDPICEKSALMLDAAPGRIAPTATAKKPSIKAYSIMS